MLTDKIINTLLANATDYKSSVIEKREEIKKADFLQKLALFNEKTGKNISVDDVILANIDITKKLFSKKLETSYVFAKDGFYYIDASNTGKVISFPYESLSGVTLGEGLMGRLNINTLDRDYSIHIPDKQLCAFMLNEITLVKYDEVSETDAPVEFKREGSRVTDSRNSAVKFSGIVLFSSNSEDDSLPKRQATRCINTDIHRKAIFYILFNKLTEDYECDYKVVIEDPSKNVFYEDMQHLTLEAGKSSLKSVVNLMKDKYDKEPAGGEYIAKFFVNGSLLISYTFGINLSAAKLDLAQRRHEHIPEPNKGKNVIELIKICQLDDGLTPDNAVPVPNFHKVDAGAYDLLTYAIYTNYRDKEKTVNVSYELYDEFENVVAYSTRDFIVTSKSKIICFSQRANFGNNRIIAGGKYWIKITIDHTYTKETYFGVISTEKFIAKEQTAAHKLNKDFRDTVFASFCSEQGIIFHEKGETGKNISSSYDIELLKKSRDEQDEKLYKTSGSSDRRIINDYKVFGSNSSPLTFEDLPLNYAYRMIVDVEQYRYARIRLYLNDSYSPLKNKFILTHKCINQYGLEVANTTTEVKINNDRQGRFVETTLPVSGSDAWERTSYLSGIYYSSFWIDDNPSLMDCYFRLTKKADCEGMVNTAKRLLNAGEIDYAMKYYDDAVRLNYNKAKYHKALVLMGLLDNADEGLELLDELKYYMDDVRKLGGYIYYYGALGYINYAKSIDFFSRIESADFQYLCGLIAEEGGLSRFYVAYYYYKKAGEMGHKEAAKIARDIEDEEERMEELERQLETKHEMELKAAEEAEERRKQAVDFSRFLNVFEEPRMLGDTLEGLHARGVINEMELSRLQKGREAYIQKQADLFM